MTVHIMTTQNLNYFYQKIEMFLRNCDPSAAPSTDKEDLQNHLTNLKKHNINLTTENGILRVRVRKLQEELSRKNKQLDAVLEPQKSSYFRRVIGDRGAQMLINLKRRNETLEQILINKDIKISHLERQLIKPHVNVINKYQQVPSPLSPSPTSPSPSSEGEEEQSNNPSKVSQDLSIKYSSKCIQSYCEADTIPPATPVIDKLINLLEGMRDTVPASAPPPSRRTPPTPAVSQEEVVRLQRYLFHVVDEVDRLKEVIVHLHKNYNEKGGTEKESGRRTRRRCHSEVSDKRGREICESKPRSRATVPAGGGVDDDGRNGNGNDGKGKSAAAGDGECPYYIRQLGLATLSSCDEETEREEFEDHQRVIDESVTPS